MMHNPKLETFIRVADSGSFSKAAEGLYLTPTAVIKQINILEDDLEMRLFVRTHRGIIMTESGKSLYKDAKHLIKYTADSIARAKKAANAGDEHIIRIGTSLMTHMQFLAELLPKVCAMYPNLKYQLVPFENTEENVREIVKNIGRDIDLYADIFNEDLLKQYKCTALELTKEPICCAVSIRHRLAEKDRLTIDDLFGENLMVIQNVQDAWNKHVDLLRSDIAYNYPQITIVDFPFYDVSVLNQCEIGGDVLVTVGVWKNVHPLLKIIPVDWNYSVPIGFIHSLSPPEDVLTFISAVSRIYGLE